MRKTTVLMMLLALAAPAGAAAQGQGPPPTRRAHLEAQVRSRFLEIASRRLDLTAPQRERLEAVLEEGAATRRELARESIRLRQRLMDAAPDSATPSSTFEEILREMEALREREHALERQEQERLAGFLEPRQRALFLMMRMRFNDQVRELRRHRPR